MPPRPVLLLVTWITLVGAAFSLPRGLATAAALAPARGAETKWVKAGDLLVRRSLSTLTLISTSTSTPDHAAATWLAAADPSATATPNSNDHANDHSKESSPQPLTLGSKGDAVRELQAILKRLGYYYGSVNGVLGKDTQTAINRFQKEAGLPETKEVDPATLENLKQAEYSLSSQEHLSSQERVSSQSRAGAASQQFEADGALSPGSPAARSEQFPGGSSLLPSPTSTPIPGDGVGEIDWMGWVMGSVAGLAIAGGLLYGWYRSGNRFPPEDADYSLSGVDQSKIFEQRLGEGAEISSQASNSLNGRGGDEIGGQTPTEGRSMAPATVLNSGADLPSFLAVQLEPESLASSQPEVSQPEASQPEANQPEPKFEPLQSELPPAEDFHRSIQPSVSFFNNSSGTSEPPEVVAIQSAEPNALTETTRIPKLNRVDQLLNDLHGADPVKRRGAIWELGQEGDSRAVQPLVDLMLEADSQERTLILAAIAEISMRTLKPMKRALLTSLQDENSDVRKNAIRDTTRVYDMMAQLSQLLSHAVNDPDPDVQDTAQWALAQISRLRPTRIDHSSTSPDHDRDETEN